jgi:CDP-4-dehydro-6-deoxyglucose reductase
MFQVTLQNTTHFSCSPEDTILTGAQKEGIHLNYSCKTGRCQSCKAKVLEGTTMAISDELGLSLVEQQEGYILTCVRKPVSDLNLDLEDLSGYAIEAIRILPSKIDSIMKLSTDIIALKLRIPPNSSFRYLAGQYINIIKGEYKRSYSIANYNSSVGLELYIKNYAGGKFSQYLFHEAKEDDLLRIEGPMGTFFIRENTKTNLVFLATGTGIAPIKAILEDLDANNMKAVGKNIYLFSGARNLEDLIWEPQFKNINVHYIPVLSRANDDWNGETGYIQNVMIQKGIPLADSSLYACGSENMIQDALHVSTLNGLSEQDFFSDAFISSN